MDESRPDSAAGRPELGVGATLHNYQIRSLVGEGATSKVFLAEQLVRGDRVAVKALRPELHRSSDLVRRFSSEASTAALVRHENVVRIYEYGEFAGWQHYMLMEYLEGNTLAAELARGPMPFDRVAPLVLPLCDALARAHHRGVVHRDLKPEHIYLVPRGDGVRPVLVDFGAARRAVLDPGERRTIIGAIVGTASYMSPEQALGAPADARSDIYSFGVILFELATGRVPFDSQDIQAVLNAHRFQDPPRPKDLNPAVSTALQEVILRCLAKEPGERFQNMADLGRAIFQAWHRPETPLPVPHSAAPVAEDPPSGRVEQRRHHRTQRAMDVKVETPASVFPEDAVAADPSASGAFVSTSMRLPLLFSPVKLTLDLGHDVVLAGEVVRVEAPAPGVPGRRGFAVRFDALDAETRGVLLRFLQQADPPPQSVDGDPEAAHLIHDIGGVPESDYYALLGLPPQVDVWAIRGACERLSQELDPTRFPALSDGQRALIAALRGRLAQAEEVLVDPVRRAEYDATRGNFAGVAQALSEGLTLDQLARLRRVYLSARPGVESAVRPQVERADRSVAQGDVDGALTWLAVALQADPLNVDLQRRYWSLRSKLPVKG